MSDQVRKFWLAIIGLAALVIGLIYLTGQSEGINWPKIFGQANISIELAPSITPQFHSLPKPTPTQAPIKLLFTGDLMFDRNIRLAAKKSGNDYIFAPIKSTLAKADLVIANLEGPITNFPSRSVGSAVGSPANYSFTFDPSLANTLKQHNIGLVNLGNNHILNFGQAGLDQTLDYLKNSQVEYFGQISPTQDLTTTPLSKTLTFDDQTIAFVSYNQFSPSPSDKVVLAEIAKLEPIVDWLVIFAHWDREYEPIALPQTTQLAHKFIDAGADLIIGGHPHVIQNHEVYRGKEIYYSLGNFVFDQYFEPAVKRGMLVSVEINPVTKIILTKPVYFKLDPNGQTVLE